MRVRNVAFLQPKDQAFFLSSRGHRLCATGLKNGFAEVRKFAGLDDGKTLRPHDLRHRFAVTRLSINNAPTPWRCCRCCHLSRPLQLQ